jgi:hypothetical protein
MALAREIASGALLDAVDAMKSEHVCRQGGRGSNRRCHRCDAEAWAFGPDALDADVPWSLAQCCHLFPEIVTMGVVIHVPERGGSPREDMTNRQPSNAPWFERGLNPEAVQDALRRHATKEA